MTPQRYAKWISNTLGFDDASVIQPVLEVVPELYANYSEDPTTTVSLNYLDEYFNRKIAFIQGFEKSSMKVVLLKENDDLNIRMFNVDGLLTLEMAIDLMNKSGLNYVPFRKWSSSESLARSERKWDEVAGRKI